MNDDSPRFGYTEDGRPLRTYQAATLHYAYGDDPCSCGDVTCDGTACRPKTAEPVSGEDARDGAEEERMKKAGEWPPF